MFDYLAKFSKISKTFSRKLIILALHSIDPYKNSKTYIYMCVPNLIFSISPVCVCVCVCVSCSVMSDSLRPHGLQLARLLCPWNSPGKNTGVGCHFFFHKNPVISG